MMDEPVNNRDHTGGIGEHFGPFGKRAVGGDDGGFLFISTVDDIKEQIRMTVAIGQVPDFVNLC